MYPSLAMSKDNSLGVLVNPQNEIKVWYVYKKELEAKFTHSDNNVRELTFTPVGKYLISIADEDHYLKIWELAIKSLYGQSKDKTPSSLFVTSDSKFLAYKTLKEVSFWGISFL
jgi:WD40 repeat protein